MIEVVLILMVYMNDGQAFDGKEIGVPPTVVETKTKCLKLKKELNQMKPPKGVRSFRFSCKERPVGMK